MIIGAFALRAAIFAALVGVSACQDVTSSTKPEAQRALIGNAASNAITPAAAAPVYRYTGNPFVSFSCGASDGGGTCATPAPTNKFTSYTATDHITATLTLADPLPANASDLDLTTLPGFQLSLNDGHQTLTQADGSDGLSAEISTDANGRITKWYLGVGTTDGRGILTASQNIVIDQAYLECCDPTKTANLADNQNPGSWSVGAPSPSSAIKDLIGIVGNPSTGLKRGQVRRFTAMLDAALASVQAGHSKQAINELRAFIRAVRAAERSGRLSAQEATMLIAAANAIIATL